MNPTRIHFKRMSPSGAILLGTVDFRQNRPDALVQHKIGLVVCRGGLPIDDNQITTAEIIDKSGGRVNSQRGAAYYKHIGRIYGIDGVIDGVIAKLFAIQNDIGTHQAAAGTERYVITVYDMVYIIAFSASAAMISVDGAVQLIYGFAAGCLMQTVAVLGNDSDEFSAGFKLGKLIMCRVRLCIECNKLAAIKFVEFFGMGHKKIMTEHRFGRTFEFLMIQPVNTAVIGNSAFCRNTGAAEENYMIAFGDHLLKLCCAAHNKYPH